MRSRSFIRQLLVQFRARLPKLLDPAGPHFEQRVVTRSGLPNVIEVGEDHSHLSDLYHLLLTMPWMGFFGLVFFIYMGANGIFALLYLAGGNAIARAEPGSFWDAFFFSVQTMASLGYGAMHPDSFYTDLIVTLESLVGLLGLATITGIVFARVSRPTARVIFSDVATVSRYNGVPTLMFRMRNQRRNQILEGQIMLTLLLREVSEEGQLMYRFHSLDLVRSQTPIFALTWTVMHAIDRASPLYGMDRAKLSKLDGEIIATLTGLDETFSQTIHARHSYLSSEIFWNYRFIDVFSTRPDGRRVVNYLHFHDVIPEGEQHPSERAA
ncbi:ion channel [Synechococcus sp. PCC 7336]|uniref:ion channel n=1 Tax=Synechococcus sp. PCC 7336 TaxID=195250 RepID=UPI0003756183|nr:ion channel [Synechococcus sp. PCC 7336]